MDTAQYKTARALMARGEESLKAARILSEQNLLADANSRAYYGMFHAAKACLTAIGVRAKSHSAVGHLLSKHLVKTGHLERKYTQMLAIAMQVREESDYTADFTRSEDITAGLLADAETFIDRMRRLLDEWGE